MISTTGDTIFRPSVDGEHGPLKGVISTDPILNLGRIELRRDKVIDYVLRRDNPHVLDDRRYTAHVALKALGIDQMIRPFFIQEPKSGTVPIVGFSDSEKKIRAKLILSDTVDAEKMSMIDLSIPLVKPMPFEWATGDVYRFELNAIPRWRPPREEKGPERDLYEVEHAMDSKVTRVDIYRRWLSRQLRGAAEVIDFEITRCEIIQMLFRVQRAPSEEADHKRRITRPWLPDATFCGTLRVEDPLKFVTRCREGVGPGKFEGFGMLRLHPSF